VAPALPEGLSLSFEGQVTSKPYIDMTASLMRQFGATIHPHEQGLFIPHQHYKPTEITIESDWSAISYWFAFVALAREAEIRLPNITLRSLQGDRVVVDIMELLGVKSEPRGNDLLLVKKEHQPEITWDFKHCPDLAQTVSVVCAAKGIHGKFTGLESLRIKETDRIAALQTELAKLGASLEDHENHWKLNPSIQPRMDNLNFHTYLDHRMAMAFAPLATLAPIKMDDPAVVRKSYPRFWEDVKDVGFKVEIEVE
jgi:3-phosphoshikimate 1-carboxyvinyltransferase